MNNYKLLIRFKDNRILEIDTTSEENPLEIFQTDWKTYKKEGAIAIGKYMIDIEAILYIKVEGNEIVIEQENEPEIEKVKKVAKRTRKKISNKRKKII